MATAWSSFIKYIRPYLKGCPDKIIQEMVIRNTQKFCVETHCYHAQATNITVTSGTSEYSLAFSGSVEPLTILWARIGADYLKEISEEKLRSWEGIDWREDTGSPSTHYFLTDDLQILLYPEPSATLTTSLEVMCIVKPTLTATSIDDFIYQRYWDIIAEGVLFDLKRMPNAAWSDPEGAIMHYDLYRRGVSRTKRWMRKNSGRESSYVRPVYFGGTDT